MKTPEQLRDAVLARAPSCEVCGKLLHNEGRRCCDGIGECFRVLHQRDQEKRLDATLAQLVTAHVPVYEDEAHRVQLTTAIRAAFEAGRKF
jgi:uncharacterized paraquat-inducible protein A